MKALKIIILFLVCLLTYTMSTWVLFDTFDTNDGTRLLGMGISLGVAVVVGYVLNKFLKVFNK